MAEKTVKTLINEAILKYSTEKDINKVYQIRESNRLNVKVLLAGFISLYPTFEEQDKLDNETLKEIFGRCSINVKGLTDEDCSKLSYSVKKLINKESDESGVLFNKEEYKKYLDELENSNYDEWDKISKYRSLRSIIDLDVFDYIPIQDIDNALNEIFQGSKELIDKYNNNHNIYRYKFNKAIRQDRQNDRALNALEIYNFLPIDKRHELKILNDTIIKENEIDKYLEFKSLKILSDIFSLSTDNILWNLPKKHKHYRITSIFAAYALCKNHERKSYRSGYTAPRYMVEKAGKYAAMVRMMNYDWAKVYNLLVKDNQDLFTEDIAYLDYINKQTQGEQ